MQDFLKQKAGAFATWLGAWCKDNIDFALILAVCTETPRWTVTFLAIHEPLWIGISLGVLLAFATSKVWRYYFTTKSVVTLRFNIAAIVLAVLVIMPVLFAMIEHKPDQVDIAQVLKYEPLRWAWSFGLALTTFVPLVQLAAVHGAKQVPNECQTGAIEQASRANVQPSGVQSAKLSTQENKPDAQSKDAQDAHKARLLKSEGLTNTQIAQELDVHRNTVTKLLKSANGHNAKAVLS